MLRVMNPAAIELPTPHPSSEPAAANYEVGTLACGLKEVLILGAKVIENARGGRSNGCARVMSAEDRAEYYACGAVTIDGRPGCNQSILPTTGELLGGECALGN